MRLCDHVGPASRLLPSSHVKPAPGVYSETGFQAPWARRDVGLRASRHPMPKISVQSNRLHEEGTP